MPTPEPEEIETTREVLSLTSYSDTQSRIEALEDVQWTAQMDDNEKWLLKRDKYIRMAGNTANFGVSINPESPLGRIRTRSQLRFGMTPTDEYGNVIGGATSFACVEIVL
jgi:hypothetical protein